MARDITSRIYGTPEDWDYIIGGQPDYGQVTWHDTHWIYDPANGTGQEYNYPPEQSIALWGVRSDFGASAKSVTELTIDTFEGERKLVVFGTEYSQSEEDSTPLIAFMAKAYGQDEPYRQWITPCAQWGYDIITDDGNINPATRLPDNGVTLKPTLMGKSRAIAWLDRRNWVTVPSIGLMRRNPTPSGTIERYGREVSLSELRPLLAQGWIPTNINFGSYYVGPIEPTEENRRFGFTHAEIGGTRLFLASDTTTDLKMTDSLHYYYAHMNIPNDDTSAPTTRICRGDGGTNYSQAPFTAYGVCSNTVNIQYPPYVTLEPNMQGVTGNINNRGIVIGGYVTISGSVAEQNSQLNLHLPKADIMFEFDDVSYHWQYDIYYADSGLPVISSDNRRDDGGPIYTVDIEDRDLVIFSNIVIDDDKGNTPTQAMYNAVLHECATAGWWFAEDGAHAEAIATGSNTTGVGMYLPLLDEGITTGLYLTGEDIADSDQADMGDTRDIDYTPTPYPDIVPDGRSGDWSYTYNYYNIESNKYYILNHARYLSLRNLILASDTSDPDHPEAFLDFNGINAGDWITTLRWYPLNIPEKSTQMLRIGPMDTSVEYRWDEDVDANTYHLGQYTINESTIGYPDFRGFSMTKCYLRLPFYGDFELDLHRYYGYTLRVRAFVDFSSGYGAYYIESEYKGNWFLFDTVDFKIGYALPLNSIAMGTYQNQMHAAEKQLLNSKIALAGAVGTTMFGLGLGASIPLGMTDAADVGGLATKTVLGGGAGIIGAASKIGDAKYALEHTAPNPGKCLPGSPYCALPQDISPRIIFVYPKCASGYGKGGNGGKLTEYGKTTGFACIQQGKLSGLGLNGLTVISNARFNQSTGTGRETALIAQALSAGIIL